jgi:hypothetical protein
VSIDAVVPHHCGPPVVVADRPRPALRNPSSVFPKADSRSLLEAAAPRRERQCDFVMTVGSPPH